MLRTVRSIVFCGALAGLAAGCGPKAPEPPPISDEQSEFDEQVLNELSGGPMIGGAPQGAPQGSQQGQQPGRGGR